MKKDSYITLAAQTIKIYLEDGRVMPIPKNLPKEMLEKQAGVFVSIHKRPNDELRGCIGTFLPTCKNVAGEIIQNAISAATQDYRFAPIEAREMPELEIAIDVLSEPEPIQNPNELDPQKYGVIVRAQNNSRSGLLLPDLPGVKTAQEQISIARQKAGISPNEPVLLFRFTAERHK